MFTVRIEHGRAGEPRRSVETCAAYDVEDDDDAGGVLVTLKKPVEGGPEEKQEIRLRGRGRIFVMNDQGVTIDVIRATKKKENARQ